MMCHIREREWTQYCSHPNDRVTNALLDQPIWLQGDIQQQVETGHTNSSLCVPQLEPSGRVEDKMLRIWCKECFADAGKVLEETHYTHLCLRLR